MAADAPGSRRRLLATLRIVVALGLTGLLAWKAGIGDLIRGPESLYWPSVLLAAALVPVSIGIRAYNHALLLNRPRKVLGARDAYALTLVGVGINLFVPTGAADLAKAHWGWRRHGNPEAMVVSAVLDKVTSLIAVAVLGAFGSLAAGLPVAFWISVAIVVAGTLPFVAPRIVPWRLLLRVLAPGTEPDPELVTGISRPPLGLLTWVLIVSGVGWLFTYSILWLCLLAVGAVVPPTVVASFAPVSTVVKLVPISAGGIGLGEVTLAVLLSRAGVPADLAARGVLLSMLLLTFVPGAVGLVLIARGSRSESGA